jgi:hypothetical protein
MSHYGHLTAEMIQTITPFIQNRTVWDLGAGTLWHAQQLLKMGAKEIIAVEKEPIHDLHPKVHVVNSYFSRRLIPPEGIPVAYLSWPVNYRNPELIEMLKQSGIIIYLGSNMDGSVCGDIDLFRHVTTRTILAHHEHPHNTLTIYGSVLTKPRQQTPEEWAALNPYRIWNLVEATACLQ